MNKPLPLIITLLFAVFSLFAQPPVDREKMKRKSTPQSESLLRISSHNEFRPGKITEYIWEDESWKYSKTTLIKYSPSGKRISEKSYVENGDSLELAVFDYDKRDSLETSSYYDFDTVSGKWVGNYRQFRNVDDHGYVVHKADYLWSDSLNTWVKYLMSNNYYRDLKYDSQGRLIEDIYKRFNRNNSTWEIEDKTEFIYKGDEKGASEETLSLYMGDGTYYAYRKTITSWKDYDKDQIFSEVRLSYNSVTKIWDTTRFTFNTYTGDDYVSIEKSYNSKGKVVDIEKDTYVIDDNGNENFIQEYYNDSTGAFEAWAKGTNFRDAYGHEAGFNYFAWYEGDWVLDEIDLSTRTYNSEGVLTEEIIDEGYYENFRRRKLVFDNIILGQNAETAGNNKIRCYPNPVSDVLHIDMQSETYSRILIKDLRGIVVAEQKGTDSVDMSALPQGVYITEIETPAGSKRQTIIKN